MSSKIIGRVRQVAKLVDLTKCTGCRACQVACKSWNRNPAEKTEFFQGPGYQNPADLSADTWCIVKFREEEREGSGVNFTFQHYACMHCHDAECVKACPTTPKARVYHPMGFTYTKWDLCIGCGMCAVRCPYKACHIKTDRKGRRKAYKCWFCYDRVTSGDQPACARACRDAIFFGDRATMIRRARLIEMRSKGRKVFLTGLKQYGGQGVLYLVPFEMKKFYQLSAMPQEKELETAIADYLKSDEGKSLGVHVRAALQQHMGDIALA